MELICPWTAEETSPARQRPWNLAEDFVIQYCQELKKRDFTAKTEILSREKLGKREYLNDAETKGLVRALSQYFEAMVEVPRIRVGKRQTIETLINEEALLLAGFLRDERKQWIPRTRLHVFDGYFV